MPQDEERIDTLADLLEAEHKRREAKASLRTHDEMLADFPPLRDHHPSPTDSLAPTTTWHIEATVHVDGMRRSAPLAVLLGLVGGLVIGAGLTVLAYHWLGGIW